MPFDKKKFVKAAFVSRTEAIPVPDLKDFFEEKDKPVWIVRNLTGHELGKVNEAADRNKSIAAIMEGIISADAQDKVAAIKASLGLDDSTPADIVKRIEMLTVGSVDPQIDHELAVKLCENYPIEFFQLTNAITRLTGQGAEIKKKQTPSTATPESATP
jgi:hypothetical protein